MKAAVYYKNDDVRCENVARPEISSGELLLKVYASGICGSDVMEWYRIKKAPLVLGHEVAGLVEEVGEGVTKFKKGDRVTVAHHVPCNTCRFCLNGEHSVCDMLRSTNFEPGGFAEFVRVPQVNVDRGTFLLPESVSFEEGSFSEPLGCVIRGFQKARFTSGQCVLVLGSGISGLLHIKLAKALGAGPIIATDISPYRLDAAKRAGADLVIDAKDDVPAIIEESYGRKADFVSICAGADKAIEQGLSSVERGGNILLFAPKEPGETFPFPLFDLWKDNITVTTSYASPPAETLKAIELIASKRITVDDMVTHRFPIEEAKEGFALVAGAGESIKVIIEPHKA